MKRGWKILLGLVVALIALLAVNTVVLESQTEEAKVTVDGGKILRLSSGDLEVSDSGQPSGSNPGQTIVLIHGYAGSMRWFDQLTLLLSPTHRVIRIDLLGFGGSEKPENGYAISDQARLVAEALNKLDVQGAMVVGHSIGGVVTASLAEQASELVDRAVLIDMAPNDSNEYGGGDSFLQGLSYAPILGEAAWRVTPDFVIRDELEKAFAPSFDFADGFADGDVPVEDFRQMTYTSYSDVHTGLQNFLDSKPLNERFTSAAVPLMVIFGSEDQIFDAGPSLAGYGGVPGVETVTIKGAGHSPQVEKPKQVAARLEKFAAPPVPTSTGRKSGGSRKKGGSGARKKPKSKSAKKRSGSKKSSESKKSAVSKKPGGSKKSKKSSKKKG